jgi:hypothetical protein
LAVPQSSKKQDQKLKIFVRGVLALLLILALSSICLSGRAEDYPDAACNKPAAVAFAKGANSAKYKGGFERNAMDCWTVIAKQGQTLTVKLDALEKNGSFDVYMPQYEIKKGEDGLDIAGKRVTPGGDGDREITHWSGVLPLSGRYLINIVSGRGNVTYTLWVSLTDAK